MECLHKHLSGHVHKQDNVTDIHDCEGSLNNGEMDALVSARVIGYGSAVVDQGMPLEDATEVPHLFLPHLRPAFPCAACSDLHPMLCPFAGGIVAQVSIP